METTWEADCERARSSVAPPDTVDWYGRPTCRAVFVGDTAIRLGVALPFSGDSTLWERVDDSAYAVRSPERFGAGYVRVFLWPVGLVRAIHYEIVRRDWPPTRIGVRRACTPRTACHIVDPTDTSLVVQFVGDSIVWYDKWTRNVQWPPRTVPDGPIRGILLDRVEPSHRTPHN